MDIYIQAPSVVTLNFNIIITMVVEDGVGYGVVCFGDLVMHLTIAFIIVGVGIVAGGEVSIQKLVYQLDNIITVIASEVGIGTVVAVSVFCPLDPQVLFTPLAVPQESVPSVDEGEAGILVIEVAAFFVGADEVVLLGEEPGVVAADVDVHGEFAPILVDKADQLERWTVEWLVLRPAVRHVADDDEVLR